MTNTILFEILSIFIPFLLPKFIRLIILRYNAPFVLKYFSLNSSFIERISKSSLLIGFLIFIFSFFTDFNYLNSLALFLISFSCELTIILDKNM